MSLYHITQYAADEVFFIMNFIKNNIADYQLSKLTNNYMGDIPNIVGAHPLAMEYGNVLSSDDPENYTSILPAIGVEMLNDNEAGRQFLGEGYRVEEITQDYLDEMTALTVKERLEEGDVLSDPVLTSIQEAKTAKDEDTLWAKTKFYMQDQTVNISIWSDHIDVTRTTYLVIRALMKRLKSALSATGVKNLKVTAQGAIYNYEFNGTLYGAEFNLTFTNTHKEVEVDTDIGTIGEIEIYLTSTETGGQFKAIGSDDLYPIKT